MNNPVPLSEVTNTIAEALRTVSQRTVVVEAILADWHLSDRLGRGQLTDGDSDARLSVIVAPWVQRQHLQAGQSVVVTGNIVWTDRWGLQLQAQRSITVATGPESGAHKHHLRTWAQEQSDQHQLALPDQIETIVLIGPAGGDAALADAKAVLDGLPSHASVQIKRVPMGGDNATSAFAQALATTRHADLIMVVRGGGAAGDLATWDDPATVERIARHPIPILTGIGHATNISTSDLAAHHHAITPTAAAQWVLYQYRDSAPRPLGPPVLSISRPARPQTLPTTRTRQPVASPASPKRQLSAPQVAVIVAITILVMLAAFWLTQ